MLSRGYKLSKMSYGSGSGGNMSQKPKKNYCPIRFTTNEKKIGEKIKKEDGPKLKDYEKEINHFFGSELEPKHREIFFMELFEIMKKDKSDTEFMEILKKSHLEELSKTEISRNTITTLKFLHENMGELEKNIGIIIQNTETKLDNLNIHINMFPEGPDTPSEDVDPVPETSNEQVADFTNDDDHDPPNVPTESKDQTADITDDKNQNSKDSLPEDPLSIADNEDLFLFGLWWEFR